MLRRDMRGALGRDGNGDARKHSKSQDALSAEFMPEANLCSCSVLVRIRRHVWGGIVAMGDDRTCIPVDGARARTHLEEIDPQRAHEGASAKADGFISVMEGGAFCGNATRRHETVSTPPYAQTLADCHGLRVFLLR